MKKLLIPASAILLFLTFVSMGCATPSLRPTRSERAVFRAYEQAVDRAEEAVGSSLVTFRVQQTSQERQRDQRSGPVVFAGVVLTEDGHLLAPFTIRPDTADRIEAWIGEERYLARPLKFDDSFGMTILKITPRQPLVPLDMTAPVDLRRGEHAVVVIASDEDNEFARFAFLTFCQGVVEGRYRQFSLSPVPNQARGAPVLNTEGKLVGLMSQNNAWSLSDLREDLGDLLAETQGKERRARDENAWFGATLMPINRDYALANNLPRSALWLVHVFSDSPAAHAGFKSGDLLVELNGEPLRLSGTRAYQFFVQSLRPREGAPFSAKVLRGGREILGEGELTLRQEPSTLRAGDLGISVSEINETLVIRHNLFEETGVLITEVHRGSPAATGRQFGRNLLMPRDVITSLGGIPTPTLSAFGEALDQIRRERPDAVLVEFMRGPVTGFEALNMRIGESAADRDNGDSQ